MRLYSRHVCHRINIRLTTTKLITVAISNSPASLIAPQISRLLRFLIRKREIALESRTARRILNEQENTDVSYRIHGRKGRKVKTTVLSVFVYISVSIKEKWLVLTPVIRFRTSSHDRLTTKSITANVSLMLDSKLPKTYFERIYYLIMDVLMHLNFRIKEIFSSPVRNSKYTWFILFVRYYNR